MGRILALDYGTKRIGIAVSDETKTIAVPKPFILNAEKEKLTDFIKENQIEKILLGLPKSLSGEEARSAQNARKFADWLKQASGMEAEMIDERFTTVEAQKELRVMGEKGKRGRERVDSLAAQKMLERYLESSKHV